MKKGNHPHFMEMTAACKAKQQPHIEKEKEEKNITEVRTQRHTNSQPSPMKKGEKEKEKGKRNTSAVRLSRKDDV